jgi:hypothetical protein
MVRRESPSGEFDQASDQWEDAAGRMRRSIGACGPEAAAEG